MAIDSFFVRHSAWLGEDSGRRRVTAALVALTLASALAWGWAVWRSSLPVPAVAAAAPPAPLATQLSAADLAHLLKEAGAAASPPAPAQRFVVLGVIARPSGQGAALIAVDGAPAQPFSVGAEVAPGFVIQRLAAREVMLATSMAGPVTLVLPLPAWERAPAAAASAATPPAAAAGDASSAQPQRRGESGGP
jgi:general secretion pathway protein C